MGKQGLKSTGEITQFKNGHRLACCVEASKGSNTLQVCWLNDRVQTPRIVDLNRNL